MLGILYSGIDRGRSDSSLLVLDDVDPDCDAVCALEIRSHNGTGGTYVVFRGYGQQYTLEQATWHVIFPRMLMSLGLRNNCLVDPGGVQEIIRVSQPNRQRLCFGQSHDFLGDASEQISFNTPYHRVFPSLLGRCRARRRN
jgi:hypothetical protein